MLPDSSCRLLISRESSEDSGMGFRTFEPEKRLVKNKMDPNPAMIIMNCQRVHSRSRPSHLITSPSMVHHAHTHNPDLLDRDYKDYNRDYNRNYNNRDYREYSPGRRCRCTHLPPGPHIIPGPIMVPIPFHSYDGRPMTDLFDFSRTLESGTIPGACVPDCRGYAGGGRNYPYGGFPGAPGFPGGAEYADGRPLPGGYSSQDFIGARDFGQGGGVDGRDLIRGPGASYAGGREILGARDLTSGRDIDGRKDASGRDLTGRGRDRKSKDGAGGRHGYYGKYGSRRDVTDRDGRRDGSGRDLAGRHGSGRDLSGRTDGTGRDVLGGRDASGRDLSGRTDGTGRDISGWRDGSGRDLAGRRDGRDESGRDLAGRRDGRDGSGRDLPGRRDGTGRDPLGRDHIGWTDGDRDLRGDRGDRGAEHPSGLDDETKASSKLDSRHRLPGESKEDLKKSEVLSHDSKTSLTDKRRKDGGVAVDKSVSFHGKGGAGVIRKQPRARRISDAETEITVTQCTHEPCHIVLDDDVPTCCCPEICAIGRKEFDTFLPQSRFTTCKPASKRFARVPGTGDCYAEDFYAVENSCGADEERNCDYRGKRRPLKSSFCVVQ